eukprot:Em0007g838a
MAAMRTVLQLRLFIALLCAASCCYGLPWVDSEDADTPVDMVMDENAPGDETEAEWEDEVLMQLGIVRQLPELLEKIEIGVALLPLVTN